MPLARLQRLITTASLSICFLATLAIAPGAAEDSRNEFPGRRVGGGTRSGCLVGDESLVALNPVNNLGVTASERPSLYFAVPPREAAYPVTFSLRDEADEVIYEANLETQVNQEFLEVQIPENTLAVDQDYQWFFAFGCDTYASVNSMVLSGWLRQVASEPLATHEALTLTAKLEQADAYHTAGLWSDAIATVMELRQQYPHHPVVQTQWTSLLEALELEWIAQPIDY